MSTGGPAPGATVIARCAWCEAALDPRSEGPLADCERCGSATTWPIPGEAALAEAYSTWYRPEGGRFSGPGDRLLRRSRGLLARRLDLISPPGPILDVGSGDGALLEALRVRGRRAVGLERSQTGPDVLDADIRELDSRWAAIVFWHSLEHLRDAGDVFAHAAGLVVANGLVVVAMPNPASLQARVFGQRWLALDLPRHLVHVPASALIARARELDLEVERVSRLRGGQVMFGWLHGLVGELPGHPDLYAAIRRSSARSRPMSGSRRALALAAGVALAPVAAAATAGEVLAQRSGTTYLEARRPPLAAPEPRVGSQPSIGG